MPEMGNPMSEQDMTHAEARLVPESVSYLGQSEDALPTSTTGPPLLLAVLSFSTQE